MVHRDNMLLLAVVCVMWGLIVMLGSVAYERGFDQDTIILWLIFGPFVAVMAFGIYKFWKE